MVTPPRWKPPPSAGLEGQREAVGLAEPWVGVSQWKREPWPLFWSLSLGGVGAAVPEADQTWAAGEEKRPGSAPPPAIPCLASCGPPLTDSGPCGGQVRWEQGKGRTVRNKQAQDRHTLFPKMPWTKDPPMKAKSQIRPPICCCK